MVICNCSLAGTVACKNCTNKVSCEAQKAEFAGIDKFFEDIPIGTSCWICGGFIPIDFLEESSPNRLCEKCRKLLKGLLYPTEASRGEE